MQEKDDKFGYEIALFYSSPNSIDKFRVDIDYFVKNKVEVNIFSFELPFYTLNVRNIDKKATSSIYKWDNFNCF